MEPIVNRPNKGAGPVAVLILAAGQGTRMHSSEPKVLHKLGGKPLIYYLLRLANALKPSAIGLVIGHQEELVRKTISDSLKEWGIARPVHFIVQKAPSGSGGAVLDSMPFLKKHQTALVMCGDSPLLTFDTLYAMLNHHRSDKGQVTMLTARLANPKGYGRVVRAPTGEILRIVEDQLATPKEAAINEVNSVTYCFDVALLANAVRTLKPQGDKHELFLTDCLEHVRSRGARVGAFVSPGAEEILGINNRLQLAAAERVLNRRAVERLMLSGVTVMDPAHTYVDIDVEVAQDTVLLPGTLLLGKTKVGKECRIGPYTLIEDSSVGNGCEVSFSQVRGARLLEKTVVGPYSNVRPETVAGPRAKIGNFSEVKASRIGFGSKVPHLSYIGDAEIAEDVNIGAGTITCNYDGKVKHKTVVAAKTFVGSNVTLVAPVKLGRGSYVAAGSTIVKDVSEGKLVFARAKDQVEKTRK